MELIGSTKHFTPLASKTMSPARSSFSMSRLYWKPEQPPPTTATRRPEPARFSRSMVSFTIAAALSDRRTGVGTAWECVSVWVVWVSMGISIAFDARVFLGIHRAPAVYGQNLTSDEWLLGEKNHRPRDVLG